MTAPQIRINEQVLDERLSQLEQVRHWSPRVISKLETFIRTADDYDLFRINPLLYASEKGMTETEAIDLFLYSTKCGLFEMDWILVCAFCPQVVDSLRELSKLHSHVRCPFCKAENEVVLDDYVQVAFTISSHVRDIIFKHPESLSVEDFYLKYGFPRGLKISQEVLLSLHRFFADIEPGEKLNFELDLPPGRFDIIDVEHNRLLDFMIGPPVAANRQTTSIQVVDGRFNVLNREVAPFDVTYGAASFHFEQHGQLPSGKHRFELRNVTNTRARLWAIEFPTGWEATFQEFEPFLSGKKLLTTQTFRDLFRSQVIQSSEGLTIKDITFLFTDLKGSTELYDRIGDANAYFLVGQHFETLGQAITANRGSIVKTIGDAVMATFENPADAVAAALAMMEGIKEFNKSISEALELKIGIHRGHSIAVTLNDRIDCFGQNVNIAARVQGLANAGEIYLTNDVWNAPGVRELLKSHDLNPEQVSVKGVSEKLEVYNFSTLKPGRERI
jgi:class 3 adenylate cyclase